MMIIIIPIDLIAAHAECEGEGDTYNQGLKNALVCDE
jgi:hypothetical protein